MYYIRHIVMLMTVVDISSVIIKYHMSADTPPCKTIRTYPALPGSIANHTTNTAFYCLNLVQILPIMKKLAFEFRWAVRYIFAFIAWAFLEKAMGVYGENIDKYPSWSLGFYIFAFLIYIVALNDKKKHVYAGNMEWKQGAVSGVYMTFIIALLMPVAQLIIHKAIAPELLPNLVEQAVSKGGTDADVTAEYYSLTSFIIQGIFFALSVGVLFSAVASLIVRTNKK
jgi:hypothetical protein